MQTRVFSNPPALLLSSIAAFEMSGRRFACCSRRNTIPLWELLAFVRGPGIAVPIPQYQRQTRPHDCVECVDHSPWTSFHGFHVFLAFVLFLHISLIFRDGIHLLVEWQHILDSNLESSLRSTYTLATFQLYQRFEVWFSCPNCSYRSNQPAHPRLNSLECLLRFGLMETLSDNPQQDLRFDVLIPRCKGNHLWGKET